MRKFQVPGKSWVFRDRKTGKEAIVILPIIFGESNNDVMWDRPSGTNKIGCWKSRTICNSRAESRRRNVGNRGVPQAPKNWQLPGAVFTFVDTQTKETDIGVLPSYFGESNDFASWHSVPSRRNGGSWRSNKLRNSQQLRMRKGKSRGGLLSRMRYILGRLKKESKKRGYSSLNSTPEQMVNQWLSQKGQCVACKGPLELIRTVDNRGSHCGHNHRTGEFQGFFHERCNMVEGQLLCMSNDEFTNYISWVSNLHKRSK